MKVFTVPFIADDALLNGLNHVFNTSLVSKAEHIDNLLWSDNGYKPAVTFKMAYTNNSILLKYAVKEKYTKADHQNINDPVYKDSCVEFFIAFNNEPAYYNLEFNQIGTVLAGYGTGRNDRAAINSNLLEKIETYHTIKTPGDNADALTEWELVLAIPFSVFEHHGITSLKSQVCKVNFYKCGDDLPQPHFLSWNNIINPTPDFHLPQYFGKAQFAL